MMKTMRKTKDVGIYGLTAKWYDKNSRKSRMTQMQTYANEVASFVGKRAHILEVAPGPGYLSIELAKKGFNVTGVEISPDFVKIEKDNAKEANVSVDFKEGNASHLPCEDSFFDSIICSAAFKNFKDPVKALSEMYRVLKEGGTSLIIDMNYEATSEDINNEIRQTGMKGFDKHFVKFAFKTFLKQGAYTKEDFESLLKETPFKNYKIKKEGISLFVYLYK
ncbi:class I SAM-dependent methyltransferase [Paenibacillus alginolyticus]|uniref:Class I SAM-dependent methyltransferase n=1 Tax=Paenibacillus alginolyticus TaxID=59839 RepID=A0ABT4G8L9_9BACL|nr:class I SAM-dependent methyltransferase [Paenibacillus alginolyticus]MCY9664849.1 class I SAM-dependent methyltransferase [Paenibacillus alginolyticus]MCY9692536.1 class I SAM-dependent methyltransferase [Paenibacillus alginolyticus]MEC0143742.1 class I SAM-dependent methyltransferase [Paenibacillus alginolyticus]